MNPIPLCKFANFLYKLGVPLLPNIITLIIRLIWSCYLPHSLSFGKNLILGYGGLGVVIHGRCVLGNGCHIDQNVTIGGTSKKHDVPVLGNNVYVGAGAKILGPIKIGDNVVIGANSVVVHNIPDGSLVVGIPGRIIKTDILKTDYV